MPFAGLGVLYLALAITCAIHAVRSGQQTYWLFILFLFPLLGSIVYIFAIWLPRSRLERGAMKAVSAAVRAIDPGRDVREAQAAFDHAPTAQNQMRLAAALLDAGDPKAAAFQYEACLAGPHAGDPDIRLGAAHAFVECHRYADALHYLELLRGDRPDFRPEPVSLLRARALAGLSRASDARTEFESAVARFGTYEANAEYAIFAYATADTPTAERLDADLARIEARWTAHAREVNDPVARRLRAARQLVGEHR
ncbi:MAG: PLDc N-terminal domain-containing protein [Burkholderiales bacterium]|nr:PLDc N-terminal domain-containing protein [Burkholderiales bacterium]